MTKDKLVFDYDVVFNVLFLWGVCVVVPLCLLIIMVCCSIIINNNSDI